MKTKIFALLFLIAFMGIQVQFIAHAAEPPSITSPLADDDDDTTPPSLGGDDDDTTPPSLGGDDDDTTPPSLGGDDDDDTSDSDSGAGTSGGSPLPTGDDDDDSVGGTTGGDNGSTGDTNIISETGPEVAFLLVPSLILGYAYKKKK